MSSHHFVKDGQEPALIIANGESCAYTLLTSLLEWCPLVVVCDGAYQRVIDLQVNPDVVIGDFDSITDFEKKINTSYIKDENQKNTDLEKAIEYLIEKGVFDINIVWATGRRLDHTLNNMATLGKYADLNIVLYDDLSKAHVLHKSFVKYYAKNTKISLVPLPSAHGITTQNLEYSLTNEDLTWGQKSGTSNHVKENGEVKITYKSGVLALIESVD